MEVNLSTIDYKAIGGIRKNKTFAAEGGVGLEGFDHCNAYIGSCFYKANSSRVNLGSWKCLKGGKMERTGHKRDDRRQWTVNY